MIPHGKIHKTYSKSTPTRHSHLEPIRHLITKGVADATSSITIRPEACDVKGAKRHNGQQCVIARALHRVYKPQAVAVGRSLAYAVFDGLAIRFRVPPESRQLLEEFDQKGTARSAPFSLCAVSKTWKLGHKWNRIKSSRTGVKRKRMKKIGVRAVGGGITK